MPHFFNLYSRRTTLDLGRHPGMLHIEDWVGLRTSLDTGVQRKLLPHWELYLIGPCY